MIKMELQLSLSLSNNCNNNKNYKMMMMMSKNQENKKRCLSKAFDDIDEEEVNSSDVVPKTLSLFVWKSNGDEDHSDNNNPRDHIHSSIYSNKNDEENGIMGWPPINRWMKKMCYYNLAERNILNNCEIRVENGGGNNVRRNGVGIYGGRNPKSMYVKVKMEGVGIARKIDLSAHHSFHSLTHSLMLMFGKCHGDTKEFKLTYEDEDGAWLLAGDQPWGNFVQTVQRLKLLKNGENI